jgi:hypothetical protein
MLLNLLGPLMLICAALPTVAAPPSVYASYDYVSQGEAAIGDVNGDGFPDIVELGTGTSVLLGSANGMFQPGPVSGWCGNPGVVPRLADLNGDGKLDLAFGAYTDNDSTVGLGVCLGNGDGTFQALQFYPIADQFAERALVGDFNGDHILDVAIPAQQGTWFFWGNGDGSFQRGVLLVDGASADAAADFNRDGALDLLVQTSSGFGVMLGNGNGTFQAPLIFATPTFLGYLAVGDVNLDGYPDVILEEYEAAPFYSVYLGKGNGMFAAPTHPVLPVAGRVAIGDVNSDGEPDLVIADEFSSTSDVVYLALGNGKGQFAAPASFPASHSTAGSGLLLLADLRKNGLLDIVEAGDFISVLLNQGKGRYEDGVPFGTESEYPCGAAADFNLDGKPDLAVSTDDSFSLFLGTGVASAPFAAGATVSLSAVCIFAGDFNNDGIPDLLVPVQSPAQTMNLYLGNGAGEFTPAGSTPSGIHTGLFGNNLAATADFNHDGNLDWATIGNVFSLGNGDGTFQTPLPLIPSCVPASCGLLSVAAADLNHDGWSDLAVALGESTAGESTVVLINNQHGGFTQTTLTPPPTGSPIANIAFGDVNGDGNTDILVSLVEPSGAAIYLGDGQGGFVYGSTLSVLGDATSALIADVNGDGIADIEITSGGAVAIFLGTGGGAFAAPFYIGPSSPYTNLLGMNLHGQAPNSGIPDLVYPFMVLINETR